jgi:hypothetical protein
VQHEGDELCDVWRVEVGQVTALMPAEETSRCNRNVGLTMPSPLGLDELEQAGISRKCWRGTPLLRLRLEHGDGLRRTISRRKPKLLAVPGILPPEGGVPRDTVRLFESE